MRIGWLREFSGAYRIYLLFKFITGEFEEVDDFSEIVRHLDGAKICNISKHFNILSATYESYA